MTLTQNELLPQIELSSEKPCWYAVRVRSNFEMITSTLLRGKDIEEFCPTYKSIRRWSDRTKAMQRPLFPGYVFCRIPLAQRVSVLSTQGVVGIVGAGRIPIAIPEQEIEAVRAIVKSDLAATPWPYLQVGHRVLMQCGPLAGTEGVVLEVKSQLRLVVSIDILRRAVATEIDRTWIRPLQTPRTITATA